MRREAGSKIGWLDPQFFVYSDEVDFCKRLADEGADLPHRRLRGLDQPLVPDDHVVVRSVGRVLGSEHEVSRLLVLPVTIKSMRQAMSRWRSKSSPFISVRISSDRMMRDSEVPSTKWGFSRRDGSA